MSTAFNPFTKKPDIISEIAEGAGLPATANNGEMYYDTNDAILYVYYNGWVAVGSRLSQSLYGEASYGTAIYYGPRPATYA